MDDSFAQGYSSSGNRFRYNHNGSISALSGPNQVNGNRPSLSSDDHPTASNGSQPPDASPSSRVTSEGDMPRDFLDGVLDYINQMLMEEDSLDDQPWVFHDCSALQSAEKSFYDVLSKKYPPSPSPDPAFVVDHGADNSDNYFTSTCKNHTRNTSTAVKNFVESNLTPDQVGFESSSGQSSRLDYSFESNMLSFGSSDKYYSAVDGLVDSATSFQNIDSSSESQFFLQSREKEKKISYFFSHNSDLNCGLQPKDTTSKILGQAKKNGRERSPNGSGGKRNRHQEPDDRIEWQSNKQFASYTEESEQSEMYDKVLLCRVLNPGLHEESQGAMVELRQNRQSNGPKRGRPSGKNQGNRREVVDLRALLIECSQAIASSNRQLACELLKRIRQHSSPYGDGTQRLAHCFGNALEARLTGTGTAPYAAFTTRRVSAADFLKAYRAYATATPFNKMSNIFANRVIGKITRGVTRLHIIDFGILYGFQWPCIIQELSLRPGAPPKLRITGIDFPQPGFRPAQRVEETGRRLANYCERFQVPFEYNAIAKKWHEVQLEDLKIDRDEVLIVNCLYRLRTVPDETLEMKSPRDAVLRLIKRINPDIFVLGVVNGAYNMPFFFPRFREALFHFSALFDMFDDTATREDQDRMLFEKEVLGRDIMNVIACEGAERVERPETYKHWQVRNQRAGLRQLPLNQDIVREIKARVKLEYLKDFVVDEDTNWMLQGWKGRIILALSCWEPAQDS